MEAALVSRDEKNGKVRLGPVDFKLEEGEEIQIAHARVKGGPVEYLVSNDVASLGSVKVFMKSDSGHSTGLHQASPGDYSRYLNLTIDRGGLWIKACGGSASGFYEVAPYRQRARAQQGD